MSTAEQPPKRASTAGVFGVAVGLLLLAAGAFALFMQKPLQTEIDPLAGWSKSFQLPEAWPEGLEPTAAAELATGDGWVRLGGAAGVEPAGAPPEDSEPQEDASPEKEGGRGSSDFEPVDWVGLDALESGAAPDEAFLITKARENAASLRDTYFRDLPRRGVEDLESKGGRVVIETGEVLWLGFEANTVHERRYFKKDGEPTFRDSIRVNLSVKEPCVLIALWPLQTAAKVDALQPLLDVLVPLE